MGKEAKVDHEHGEFQWPLNVGLFLRNRVTIAE
jgi:hypothetical protein